MSLRCMATAVFLLLMSSLVSACQGSKTEKETVKPAFYHWKTVFDPDSTQWAYLDTLQARNLYVKFFDIDRGDSFPVPQATIVWRDDAPANVSIIPCVFITNRTFYGLEAKQVSALAEKVGQKITTLWQQTGRETLPQEVQIDCDWTEGTREAYFSFLRSLARYVPSETRLSATIRLHQAKFPDRTGVPPVDRGMLMFYNIGEVSEPGESNSILNLPAARKYLTDYTAYPLPLDLALPLFHWGVLFREGRMIRLINQLEASDLTDTTRFRLLDTNLYEVKKSTYLNGQYLYQSDQLRLEGVELESLRAISQLIHQNFASSNYKLAFYHLDSETIKKIPHDSLKTIIRVFSSH